MKQSKISKSFHLQLMLTLLLTFFSISFVCAQVPALGDYRSAASGNWNTAATWQVRTGVNTWTAASVPPTSTNNVYIQVGHLITVSTADAICKDLHLFNNANALMLSSTFNINIYGKIRAISAPLTAEVNLAADGVYTGTSVATGFATNMIVTSGTGLMRFVGVSRNITNNGEWTSSGNSHNTEFALDAGALGTLQTGYKGKKIVFSSGNFSITNSSLIACSQTLTDSGVVIRSGVRLTTDCTAKYAIAGSSTLKCGAIYLLSGGILEFTGAAPYISTAKFFNSGTIVYSCSGAPQSLLASPLATDVSSPPPLISDSLNRYTNLRIINGNTKTAVSNITVSGTFFDSTATTLNMSSFMFGGNPISVTNNGIILTTNQSSTPLPSGKTWGGTVNYNNPVGNQRVVLGSYSNLYLGTTSGADTLSAGTINVSDTFKVVKTAANTIVKNYVVGNTMNFNRLTNGQPIPATYYDNLTISSAATPPTPDNYVLAADSIYIAGTFNPGAYTSYFTVTGNTVNFNKLTGGQTIPKFNFNNLVVSNTSAPTSTICVADTIGVAGTFNPGAFVNNYTTTGNTFNFNNSTGAQTIPGFNFHNIVFTNPSATTYNVLAANINVANSLRLAGKKGLKPGTNNVVYAPNATFYFSGSASDTLYNNSPQWPDVNGPTNVTLDGIFSLIFQAPTSSFVVTNVQITGNVAIITTSAPHNFSAGSVVTMGGLSNSEYGYILGGTFTLGAGTVSGTNTFSFPITNPDVPSTAVTGGVALRNVTKTITGIFTLDNQGKLNINQGNTLRMANGSTIFRNQSAAKINMNSGFLGMGSLSTDKVNITIGNTMLSDNEFAYLTNPGGYGTLKILSGTYTPSGSRTIVDLDARPGTILDFTDYSNFNINGNILSTGTMSAKPNVNLIMGGANAGSSGKLLFTPGFQTLGSLKINRTGALAEVPMGSAITLNNYLDLTAGKLLDSGFVITNLGSITGTNGVHVSSGSGKIMMTGANNTSGHAIKNGIFTLGNLEINAGTNTIYDSTSFYVTNNLTLTSGTYATSAGTSYVTCVYGNLLGNSFYTGPGRIKMAGAGKQVSGVNVSNLEVALPATTDFIYASDTTRINSALVITSGNFRDSGKVVTVGGNILGPGTHSSYNTGKIKMVGSGSISVSGIAFGNLEIANTGLVTASTSFNVNNDLTLSSGCLLDLNSNITTVFGNVMGTGTQSGGAGKIKMVGSNKTISGITASNLEIATAAADSITAVGAVNISSGLGGLYLTSGIFNDGGYVISCSGNIIGPAMHNSTGNGEIKIVGSGKFVSLNPTLSNIEIANTGSLSAGCLAKIKGTLLMNGGNLSIGSGNLLQFLNNAVIIRSSGNLNLDTGTVAMGLVPTDLIKVFINGNLLSTNELPGNHVGYIDLTINNGYSYTLKSNSKYVRNLNVNDGRLLCLFDTLTRKAYNLTVNNIATVSGNFYLDSTQYDFPGNTFGPFKVGPSLIINNNAKLVFGNVNNKTFYSNGLLLLRSNKIGTASVGDVTNGGVNSGNKILGVATVERFISNIRNITAGTDPTLKAWRLLSMPTKHDFQTINQSWQEGGSLNSNPNPGYGTQLTSNRSTWSVDGFDAYSAGGPSIKYYNPADSSWVGITSTNSAFIPGRAYMVFVRGSRAKTLFTDVPDTTVLREKGTLNVGDTTVVVGTAGNQFVGVANPFPSAINYQSLTKSNITSFLYLYDPRLGSIGGYQTIDQFGNIIPGGGSYSSGNTAIQSSQGFFVRTTSAAGYITFKETAKTDGSMMTFRTQRNISSLRTNLYRIQTGASTLADGVLQQLDSTNNNVVDDNDALKFNNLSENISVGRGLKNLVIEARKDFTSSDTVYYHIAQMKQSSYQLEFIPEHIDNAGLLQAYLIDNFTGTTTPVSLNNPTTIDFVVNSTTGSFAYDRFKLVFAPVVALPVTITNVKAEVMANNNVKVEWAVSNEQDVISYDVLRSDNGVNFYVVGNVTSINTTPAHTYSFLDTKLTNGTYFYRIQTRENSGLHKLSEIVKVNLSSSQPVIVISPNPVPKNRIMNLYFGTLQQGKYVFTLYDLAGKKIYRTQSMITSNGINAKAIQLPLYIPSGRYQLSINGGVINESTLLNLD